MPWQALYFISLLRVTDASVLMIFFYLQKRQYVFFSPGKRLLF